MNLQKKKNERAWSFVKSRFLYNIVKKILFEMSKEELKIFMIKDKTIIVTGAARGLGQKYALEFAKAEANIIFADISDCSETEKKVSEVTDKFLSLNLDVTDINSCNNMMAKAVDKFSKIDVLVNNAALYGALKSSRFEDIDPDQWDKAMNVMSKDFGIAAEQYLQ